MSNLKGVIFDFNGTLFFDNDKHILAWNKISKEIRGRDITDEELHEKFNGTPNDQILRYMLGEDAKEDQIQYYSSLKEQYYREFCKADKAGFHLVEGVPEFMDALKEKEIPFTIASASIKANIDFFIESFGLDVWISTENIVFDDGTYKNKVAMFKKAAQILGIDMEDITVFEDSFSGIKNAYEAGCRSIIVIGTPEIRRQYESLPGVIKTIATFKEL